MLLRIWLATALLALGPLSASAQTAPPQTTQAQLSAAELDQLVAPIALYPDALLAEVLMASTYPLEIVEGARWVKQNVALKGEQLKAAADKQGWDDSIKSLTATPDVLGMMNDKLDWTQKLGDAVLAQQPDVMDAVQRLRTKSQAAGKLPTTKQQKVSTRRDGNRDVIVIEPAVARTVYVPYYDPAIVYGAWPYPDYPPYYFWPPGYAAGGVIATGIAFSAGFAIGAWVAHGNDWGGGFNWGGNNININRPIDINSIHVNNWQHNPDHRHGVKYNNPAVQQKFANRDSRQGGAQQRLDFRGRDGQQVLKPGNDGAAAKAASAKAASTKAATTKATAGKAASAKSKAASATGKSAANRPAASKGRPDGNRANTRPQRDNAFGNIQHNSVARAQADRGRASLAGRNSFAHAAARPSMPSMPSMSAGGGGFRGGGMARGGGGGRRR